MTIRNLFHYETPNDAGGGGTVAPSTEAPPTPEPTPTSPSEGWRGPSEDEWRQTQAALQGMARMLQQPPEEEEFDESELDVDAYIQRRIQEAIQPMMPVYQTAVQEAGQKRLNQLLDEHQKTYGEFDRDLASRAAQAFAYEESDPLKAVEKGVQYAVEIANKYSTKAVEDFKKSLKRGGPSDLEPEGSKGGDRQVPQAKSYEEVIERWAGETEV